ncbi:methyltransferase [Acrocarpospora phusangensis]|uniref:Methyltransferase n=1 Tax=Acrocarpospora phusangensis TaxID=1070424 RepID=A0A919QIG7_9ACTN|nr:methyltransferase [Acrocarpospora phusangensis]GIH29393.1 methyltransferase [Acrocarpospora phusangensis]
MAGNEEVWGGPLWRAADLITPMALRVAATLRVADAITEGVTSGSDLAARLRVAADPLVRLLDHLVTAGFLHRSPDGSYALTDSGQWLRDDHPEGIRAWIDAEGAIGRADLSVVELLHTVRTGEAAFPRRFGRGFWDDLAENPELSASFDSLMGGQGNSETPTIAAAYDWSALGEVIDVGGGNGTLLIALLRAHPTLRGTVLDLAAPAAGAGQALAEAGLADRGRAQAGSFFDPLPAGAGGYILSRVIHDWDDEEARRILRNCATAARPEGRVFVIEEIVPEKGDVSTEMDLRMLAYVNGRERTLDRLSELAAEAGLNRGGIIPAGIRRIIEFLPV